MGTSPAHWSRLKTVFFAAQDLEPGSRQAYIREACAGDAELEAEVLRLLELDARAGSFLQTPAVGGLSSSEPALPLCSEGDVLANRFRIISLIGRGGMGEVYEAHDDILDHVVALKVVRPGQEPVTSLAARWRQELLLSRKVTHSSVCRVHDVALHRSAEGQELLLLTMERLHGEPLSRRLRDSRLTLEETLATARQIADALDTAHEQDVLHRDVKPDNILVETRTNGTCRAVLTDFGLARTATDDHKLSITRTGLLAGTLGYIAPEVLRGRPASPQSDLYAFAVVVGEMLAVAAPVPSPAVNAVMARALSAEPSARYSSASDLVAAVTAAVTPKPRWRSRRRVLTAALASMLVVALSLYVSRLTKTAQSSVPVASEVLLTPVVNGTADGELDGLREVLRSQLAQSPHFELVETARIREVLEQMRRPADSALAPEVAREIAMRIGAPLVVYGTVTRLGQDYVISVKLEHVGSRPSLVGGSWSQTFTAPAKRALLDAVRDAAVWVRQMSGEASSMLAEQDRPASETMTSSWEALRLLTRADELSATGNHSDAVLLLEQAIRQDPEFAMAQTRLGDELISLRRDKQGYEAWQRAIAQAEQRQMTSRETLRTRAQYFDDTGNLVEALKAYQTYALHYPHDFHAQFLLGGVLTELDRVPEAIQRFETALHARPSSLAAAVHLASAYLDEGRSLDAARIIEDLDKRNAVEWSRWLKALTLFRDKRVDVALATLEPLRTTTDRQWRSRAHTIRAAWLSETGRDDLALAELHAGIVFDSENGLRDRLADKWLHVATLEMRRGDAKAAASARRALDVASNVRRTAIAAGIIAGAGDRRTAQRLASSLDEFAPVPATETARQYLLGQLHAADGNAPRSLQAFERWMTRARRSEDRMPVVRAMLANGDLSGAERLLRNIVEHPVAIYARPEPQSPGLWRQALVELERVLARRDPAAAARLRSEHAFIWPGTNESPAANR
jgi:serine/threonine protein kinase/tetratricopeptide (TPR) repeat protein